MSSAAARVTLRFAAYLNVGDLILYGKYKNKKGKILAFGQDAKGNPTVTIEPIPKGRKQDKTFSLFKVWKTPLDKQGSFQLLVSDIPMNSIATARIVNAWNRQKFADFAVGATFENEAYRVHRYAAGVLITELANAGKRGKKCKTLYVGSSPGRHDPGESVAMEFELHARRKSPWARMQQAAEEFKEIGYSISYDEKRGVDTVPGGFKPITVYGPYVQVEVGYKDFRVVDLADTINAPRCIPAIKGGLKAIPLFYRWVKDNEDKIPTMSYRDVLLEMTKLDVPYHDYCAN